MPYGSIRQTMGKNICKGDYITHLTAEHKVIAVSAVRAENQVPRICGIDLRRDLSASRESRTHESRT